MRRLAGEACAVCGATGELRETGRYEYTDGDDGDRYGWPEMVCPQH